MVDLKTILICFIGVAFLPGEIRSGKIMKDDCSSKFLSSLMKAGHEIGNKVDLTINLKYEDEEGAKKKAAIKLRDQCKEPKILCDGETNVLNEETVTGPLLLCSWRWNEKDDTTRNHVIVRLNHKKEIEVSGSISRDSENFFPHASDKGPMDFKFTTANWSNEEGKKMYRVKREVDKEDYEEDEERDDRVEERGTLKTSHAPAKPPTKATPKTPKTTTLKTATKMAAGSLTATSKAESFFHVTNKLSYALWMMWVSFLIFFLK